MTALLAAGYLSNAARTQGEMKTAFEDLVAFLRERGGAGAGWVNVTSAATTTIGTQTGRMLNFTGGVGVTSLGTSNPGDSFPFLIRMGVATTFTHGTNLQIQGEVTNGATVAFEPNDILAAYWEGSNVWRLVLVAKASGLPMAVATGMRNRIINGGFAVDQRNGGASFNITSTAAYGIDRWWAVATGATIAAQRVSASVDGPYRLRITGATSNTGFSIGQRIEAANTADLSAKPVTISVKLTGTGVTTVNWSINRANSVDGFGTLASPTVTNVTSGSFTTVSGTETTFKATFANAATVNGLELVLSTGALGAGVTLDIGDVQMEAGKTNTPFERRPIGLEIALCQRYFSTGIAYCLFGAVNSSYAHHFYTKWPVKMRTAPTMNRNVFTSSSVTGVTDISTTADEHWLQVVASASTNISYYFNWTASAEL